MTTNDELKSLLISVQSVVEETKNNVSTMAGDIKDLKLADEKFQKDLQTNSKICQSLVTKNRNLEKKIDVLEKRMEDILIRERSRNVILYNLEDSTTFNKELKQSVLEVLSGCGILIKGEQIDKMIRLGKTEGSRPLLINFNDLNCKQIIFQNSATLKKNNIYFSNDYTPKQQAIRRELRKYQQVFTQQGRVTVIKGTKLSVDGTLYDLYAIENLLDVSTPDKHANDEDGYESEGGNSISSKVSTANRKRGRRSKTAVDLHTPRTKRTRTQKNDNTIKQYFPLVKDSGPDAEKAD